MATKETQTDSPDKKPRCSAENDNRSQSNGPKTPPGTPFTPQGFKTPTTQCSSTKLQCDETVTSSDEENGIIVEIGTPKSSRKPRKRPHSALSKSDDDKDPESESSSTYPKSPQAKALKHMFTSFESEIENTTSPRGSAAKKARSMPSLFLDPVPELLSPLKSEPRTPFSSPTRGDIAVFKTPTADKKTPSSRESAAKTPSSASIMDVLTPPRKRAPSPQRSPRSGGLLPKVALLLSDSPNTSPTRHPSVSGN